MERLTVTTAEISRVIAELGRRGGRIGRKRRLETLTQEQRSKIASRAAQVRWQNRKKKQKPPSLDLSFTPIQGKTLLGG